MIKIYGKNCVMAALKAKANIKKLYLLDDFKLKVFIELAESNKIDYEIVNKSYLEKNFGNNTQGVAALREDYKTYNLEDVMKENGRILILDGISDPQNFGAIIRSCDAFSYDAIILGNNRSVPITSTVSHVSTGAIEYVKIVYVNSLLKAVKTLKENGYWIVGSDASANTVVDDISKDRSLALIVGSEGFGMSKTLIKESDYIVKIPMTGHVNSLNASVSAGILLHLLK